MIYVMIITTIILTTPIFVWYGYEFLKALKEERKWPYEGKSNIQKS